MPVRLFLQACGQDIPAEDPTVPDIQCFQSGEVLFATPGVVFGSGCNATTDLLSSCHRCGSAVDQSIPCRLPGKPVEPFRERLSHESVELFQEPVGPLFSASECFLRVARYVINSDGAM